MCVCVRARTATAERAARACTRGDGRAKGRKPAQSRCRARRWWRRSAAQTVTAEREALTCGTIALSRAQMVAAERRADGDCGAGGAYIRHNRAVVRADGDGGAEREALACGTIVLSPAQMVTAEREALACGTNALPRRADGDGVASRRW